MSETFQTCLGCRNVTTVLRDGLCADCSPLSSTYAGKLRFNADNPGEPERLIDADTSEGYLVIPLRDLPPGSLVTITVRVGPEPVAQPETVTPTPRRYMNGG